jgi:hypothetical protein
MQEHLAPIVRSTAPNVAYTVILTAWDQLRGPTQYHLDSLWPDTRIDVAGFDVYDHQGTVVDGQQVTDAAELDSEFFQPLSAWAAAHDIPWAIGETGYTNVAAEEDPTWVQATYQDVLERGGIAMNYFNSRVNSIADWTLSTPQKMAAFKAALDVSPSLKNSPPE